MTTLVEYLWLDGAKPTQQLRSKTRVLSHADPSRMRPDDLPRWSFDGSSTGQAGGSDSDLILVPVRVVRDPLRRAPAYLALCEVYDANDQPHSSNARSELRSILAAGAADQEPWFGFEQEYTLLSGGRPLGFPDHGFPEPQGPFYCGVGADNAFGREVVEEHVQACLKAGLMLYGINAEVMPGQWEFQVGHRGVPGEPADPLTVADHLWIARYLLQRIGESRRISVSFEPKPVKGDWNGAGNHTNFSTRATRSQGGIAAIHRAIERLSRRHREHIADYGAGLAERLTGLHETCSIDEFRNGIADRGASIRIPRPVELAGQGYLEDRRPGANSDPYRVCARLLETICLPDAARKAA
jgi:glutamine synthetase